LREGLRSLGRDGPRRIGKRGEEFRSGRTNAVVGRHLSAGDCVRHLVVPSVVACRAVALCEDGRDPLKLPSRFRNGITRACAGDDRLRSAASWAEVRRLTSIARAAAVNHPNLICEESRERLSADAKRKLFPGNVRCLLGYSSALLLVHQ
jgi:hypothetical protein